MVKQTRAETPGNLYFWGLAKNNQEKDWFPQAACKSVDRDGHVAFPHQLSVAAFGRQRALIRQVACDGNIFAAVAEDAGQKTALLVWGSAKRGFTPSQPDEVKALEGKDIVDVACNERSVFAVTGDGKLYETSNGSTEEVPLSEGKGAGALKAVQVDASGPNSVLVLAAGPSGRAHLLARGTNRHTSGTGAVIDGRFSLIYSCDAEGGDQIVAISLGSNHAGCVLHSGKVLLWGENKSGNLGLGHRKDVAVPTEVQYHPSAPGKTLETEDGRAASSTTQAVGSVSGQEQTRVKLADRAVSLLCTRGQPAPKNEGGKKPGQEGARTHIVTICGKLLIAGTTHKGLALDHLFKTMTPSKDHLRFYCSSGVVCGYRFHQSSDTYTYIFYIENVFFCFRIIIHLLAPSSCRF